MDLGWCQVVAGSARLRSTRPSNSLTHPQPTENNSTMGGGCLGWRWVERPLHQGFSEVCLYFSLQGSCCFSAHLQSTDTCRLHLFGFVGDFFFFLNSLMSNHPPQTPTPTTACALAQTHTCTHARTLRAGALLTKALFLAAIQG